MPTEYRHGCHDDMSKWHVGIPVVAGDTAPAVTPKSFITAGFMMVP
jgi:hypothetical protein